MIGRAPGCSSIDPALPEKLHDCHFVSGFSVQITSNVQSLWRWPGLHLTLRWDIPDLTPNTQLENHLNGP